VLKATHYGQLNLGGVGVPCVVLEDGTRLLTDYNFLSVIGLVYLDNFSQNSVTELPSFLQDESLRPFITQSLVEYLRPVPFISKEDTEETGYRAEALPEVCCVFIDADNAGCLTENQKSVANRCRVVIRWLALKGQEALRKEAENLQKGQ
jgi:hypothetical protein